MARRCSVCTLPTAGAIREALADGRSARAVADEFGISYDALTRHARNHLADQPHPAAPGVADPLEELIAVLRVRALGGSDAASREYRLALAAQTAARQAAAPRRALVDEPEWRELRAVVLRALAPFPEARVAVANALTEAGA
jgi:transposase-like protein